MFITRCRVRECTVPVPCALHGIAERPVHWIDLNPDPDLGLSLGDRLRVNTDGRELHLVVVTLPNGEVPWLEANEVRYQALVDAGLGHRDAIEALDLIQADASGSWRADRARQILTAARLP